MPHWLEAAESELKGKESKNRSAGFLDRKLRIQKNLKKNKAKYYAFINKLNDLIDRANSLPVDKKQPFGHIDKVYKNNKLENHMFSYKSNRRFEKQLPSKIMERLAEFAILTLFKPSHFKHSRKLYITVSSKIDQIGLEVKEQSMLKQRIIVDKELVDKKNEYKDRDRFHRYFNWNINEVDEEFALKILDWLAFKSNLDDLPFIIK